MFIASRLPGINAVIFTALTCTGLVILGLIYSPKGATEWLPVILNRDLAFFVIWTAVWFINDRKRYEESLHKSEARLKEAQAIAEIGILSPFSHRDNPITANVRAPVLRCKQGERMTLDVTNNLAVDSSIHWHGMILPSVFIFLEPVRRDCQSAPTVAAGQ